MDLAAAGPFYIRMARMFFAERFSFFLHMPFRLWAALESSESGLFRTGWPLRFSLCRILRKPGTGQKETDAGRSGILHMLQQGAYAAGMPETQVFMNLEKSLVVPCPLEEGRRIFSLSQKALVDGKDSGSPHELPGASDTVSTPSRSLPPAECG